VGGAADASLTKILFPLPFSPLLRLRFIDLVTAIRRVNDSGSSDFFPFSPLFTGMVFERNSGHGGHLRAYEEFGNGLFFLFFFPPFSLFSPSFRESSRSCILGRPAGLIFA